jgi:titin
LSWQPPEYDGGSRITGYLVEKSEARRPKWLRVARVGPSDLSADLDNLVENTDYYFRVIAENKMGVSSPLETSKPVKPVSPYSKYFLSYLK